MPTAAVIPAPITYIKVVAVKKLVVEPWAWLAGPPHRVQSALVLPGLSLWEPVSERTALNSSSR